MTKVTNDQYAELMDLSNEGRITEKELAVFLSRFSRPDNDLDRWKQLYYEEFDLNSIDLSALQIPTRPKRGEWDLMLVAEINHETILQISREYFRISNQTSGIFYHDRDPMRDGVYAIWVPKIKIYIEDYETYFNNHVDDVMTMKGMMPITFHERLLLQMNYLRQTGKDLRINRTYCKGSRGPGTPTLEFTNNELRIWFDEAYSQNNRMQGLRISI